MNPEPRAGTAGASPDCKQLGAKCFLLGLREGRGVGTGMNGSQSIHRAGTRPDSHLPVTLILRTGVIGQEGPEIQEEKTQRKNRPWAEGCCASWGLDAKAPWTGSE